MFRPTPDGFFKRKVRKAPLKMFRETSEAVGKRCSDISCTEKFVRFPEKYRNNFMLHCH